jgi:hypothetical protein
MRRVRKSLELVFVTELASLAADVVFVRGLGALGRVGIRGGNRTR